MTRNTTLLTPQTPNSRVALLCLLRTLAATVAAVAAASAVAPAAAAEVELTSDTSCVVPANSYKRCRLEAHNYVSGGRGVYYRGTVTMAAAGTADLQMYRADSDKWYGTPFENGCYRVEPRVNCSSSIGSSSSTRWIKFEAVVTNNSNRAVRTRMSITKSTP